MRFCKFVPLDTFSIIQSLSTSVTPSGHCPDLENHLFPCIDSLEAKGSPLAFSLERSPHLKASP